MQPSLVIALDRPVSPDRRSASGTIIYTQERNRGKHHSPVYGVLVALVDVGHRGGRGRGRGRENVLWRLRRWILGVSRTHTTEVWTVMETGNAAGITVWIVQPCTSTATTALEVTPVQPAIVVLQSQSYKIIKYTYTN